jgi:tRNA (guanine6-N2)-methyltransferase
MSAHLLARTLRGLEPVAAREVAATLHPAALATAHREVRFALPELDDALLRLGTVDDVLLVLATGPPLAGRRPDLRPLVAALDTRPLRALAARRGLPAGARDVDVSATWIGVRTAGRHALEDAAGAALADAGWRYHPRAGGARPPATALSLRLHATRAGTVLAARVGERPLHRRAYRGGPRAGALHPPLARALALLSGARPGGCLLDPMCGTGTIAIEAALGIPGVVAVGCDVDPRALALARAGAVAAGVVAVGCDVDPRALARAAAEGFLRADAAALPLADASVDAVAFNPPWGRAVAARGALAHDYAPLAAELRRVVRPGGAIVLLEPRGGPVVAALRAAGLRPRRLMWVRVAGAVADIVRACRE